MNPEAPAEGSLELDRQREWVMDYMFRNSVGSVARNYDTGTTYDCGADFCDAFLERFPGRKPDPNLVNASRRLAKLLRDMWRDRLVTRRIIGNEKYLPQEPSWQYVYSLPAREHIRRPCRHESPPRGEPMTSRADDGHLLKWDGRPGKLIHSPDDITYSVQGIGEGPRRITLDQRILERSVALEAGEQAFKSGAFSHVYVETRQAWGERMKLNTVAMWGGVGLPEGLPA